MVSIRWQDAYAVDRTNLEEVKKRLGKDCICNTHGKIVFENKQFLVLEQHNGGTEYGNDYFIVPKSIIIKRRRTKMPCSKGRKKKKKGQK